MNLSSRDDPGAIGVSEMAEMSNAPEAVDQARQIQHRWLYVWSGHVRDLFVIEQMLVRNIS